MSGKQEQLIDYLKSLPNELLNITDSIYLYGSAARGDIREDSDCDILIAIEDCEDSLYEQLKLGTANWHPEIKCELALYTIKALTTMQKKGSLFLWHIKTEGIELYSPGKKLKLILENLPAYDGSREAILEYAEIMKDIDEDLTDDVCVIEYNLSVMATLIRNICIVCCYLLGNKQFGRVSPVRYCASHWGAAFPIDVHEYELLYRYRTAINRGGSLPTQSQLDQYSCVWKTKTKKLLLLAYSLME